MISQSKITALIIDEFEFLHSEHGFNQPQVKKESWLTKIDYMKGEIAVEASLDFRDLVVDLFIVRLENGNLPVNLFISTEGRTRVYLLDFIADKGWRIPENLLTTVKTNRTDRGNFKYFEGQIHRYRSILEICAAEIISYSKKIINSFTFMRL